MVEANSYEKICEKLAKRFLQDYSRKDVNLTAIIFANPDSPFAKNYVIPEIDYWHNRSDNITDFFCAGFGAYGREDKPKDKIKLSQIRNGHWWYSSESFSKFVKDIESRSSWIHSGGCDLVIVNSRFSEGNKTVDLDFRSAISINLDEAINDKNFSNVSALMIQLFNFVKSINEDKSDLAWHFSDKMGLRVLKKSLGDWLLDFLPKSLKQGAKQSLHFACRDISPKK